MHRPAAPSPEVARRAFRFVAAFGLVNLFADMTYESARGLAGEFLGSLGAGAAAVGFVAGFGELVGYGFRSVSGYWADRTHRYWAVILAGYSINLLAVPALALAGNWPLAAALMVLERTGRAVRKPAVETMLSHAGRSIGQGWVFGLNEALDQTGATIGPLITAWVLYRRGGYHQAYAILLVPALLCLATLLAARRRYPRPQELERRQARFLQPAGFSRTYWLYVAGGALLAAGFADFPLVAYHFQRTGVVAPNLIPVFYSVAMAAGALSAPLFGLLWDRAGWPALTAFLLGAGFAPCAFFGGFAVALVGAALWGLGLGAQDALLKAILADLVPSERRATGFGVFDTCFGVAWFVGSAAMGWLYGRSLPALVGLSVTLQAAALPCLIGAARRRGASAR
ncbi:MAG TPA: MFS transporter [Opitutaceae bacterium]|jgi:MFS family permease|nr:MFS transporter [Opitutaceae bacterium]